MILWVGESGAKIMNEPTMAGLLHKFTLKEQLVICFSVRAHTQDEKYRNVQPNLLPFTPVEVVKGCLIASRTTRIVSIILAKIGETEPRFDGGNSYVTLNPYKVAKIFGRNPEKGVIFKWLPKREVKGQMVSPVVSLKLINRADFRCSSVVCRSTYKLHVEPSYHTAVSLWLVDNCL